MVIDLLLSKYCDFEQKGTMSLTETICYKAQLLYFHQNHICQPRPSAFPTSDSEAYQEWMLEGTKNLHSCRQSNGNHICETPRLHFWLKWKAWFFYYSEGNYRLNRFGKVENKHAHQLLCNCRNECNWVKLWMFRCHQILDYKVNLKSSRTSLDIRGLRMGHYKIVCINSYQAKPQKNLLCWKEFATYLPNIYLHLDGGNQRKLSNPPKLFLEIITPLHLLWICSSWLPHDKRCCLL